MVYVVEIDECCLECVFVVWVEVGGSLFWCEKERLVLFGGFAMQELVRRALFCCFGEVGDLKLDMMDIVGCRY